MGTARNAQDLLALAQGFFGLAVPSPVIAYKLGDLGAIGRDRAHCRLLIGSHEAGVADDGEYTWLVDVNKDGKQDILMHHPFTLRDSHGAPRRRPGTHAHRVTMLIAQ